MLIGLNQHLVLAVRGANPRATNLNAATAKRDLPSLVAVPDRGPLAVPLALRADDLIDLLLHHRAQHTQPDADAQRQQSLLRRPDQLAECFLHALREHDLITGRLSDRYVATHGGSSFDLGRSPATLPSGADGPGGTAVTSNFYEPRDNLPSALIARVIRVCWAV